MGNVVTDLGKLKNTIPDLKEITDSVGGPICGAFNLGGMVMNWLNGHIVKDENGAVHFDALVHEIIGEMIDRVLNFILGLRESFVTILEGIIVKIIEMKFAEIGLVKHFFESVPKALFNC